MQNIYNADIIKNYTHGWVLKTWRYCDFFATYEETLNEAYAEMAAGVVVGCMIGEDSKK